MEEQQLWLTARLNDLLGSSLTRLLEAIGIHPASPSHPISNYFAMELVVAVFIMALLAFARASLSSDRPGKIQQLLEIVVEGLKSQTEEIVGHGSQRFVPLLFTLGFFILICNVIGEIPHFESPSLQISVTLGCAMVAFFYYNAWGLHHHGVIGYFRTLLGPVWWLAPLMFIIEVISHLARLLSLSVRLMANMLAGEKITEIIFEKFLAVGAPVIFMGVHILVGMLQAYIFIFLTMVYLGGAVSEEH